MKDIKLPVILAASIKAAIEGGAWIEVECVADVVSSGNTHRGEWIIIVCNYQDGGIARAIYVINRQLRPRVFKTAAGIMTLALEHKAKSFCCPLRKGEREILRFETSKIPDNWHDLPSLMPKGPISNSH